MSVVHESDCRPFKYPTPFKLHFSNAHKEKFKEDLSDYCKKMNGVDKDLAAHITIINEVGIKLCGKEINQEFAPVEKKYYLDSILWDIENANAEIKENDKRINQA